MNLARRIFRALSRPTAGIALAVLMAAGIEGVVSWKILEEARAARRGETSMRRFAARTAKFNRTIFLRSQASPAIRGLSGEEQDELAGAPWNLAGFLPKPPR